MSEWAIEVKDLRKQYPGRDGPVSAVNGIDLQVPVGECFGLLGPNGAGKTTTVEILEGLNQPSSGDVQVLGLRWETAETAIRERIGVTLQETRFPDKQTVLEMVRLFRSFYSHGLTLRQAAAVLQSPPGAVAQRVSRARELIRKCVQHHARSES